MRAPDIDDNELDDEASRKFHEALASGKAKVRLKTMPTTTSDLVADWERLKEENETLKAELAAARKEFDARRGECR